MNWLLKRAGLLMAASVSLCVASLAIVMAGAGEAILVMWPITGTSIVLTHLSRIHKREIDEAQRTHQS
jgi:hypothetical protein